MKSGLMERIAACQKSIAESIEEPPETETSDDTSAPVVAGAEVKGNPEFAEWYEPPARPH
jgi:hypothetical protein